MSKKSAILAALTLIIIATSGCGTGGASNVSSAENGSSGQADVGQPLTIGFMSAINTIPYIVAQQRGYLPDNITLEFFRDHTARDAAMLAGQLDGVMTDMLAFFLFNEGGEDMVGISATQGRFGIAVNDDEILSPRDLEGRVIGLVTNSVVEVVLDLLVLEAGGNPELLIHEIIPQPPLRIEMLREGQIDAAVLPEPLLTSVTNDPGGRVLAYSEAPFTLVMVERGVYENKRAELNALFAAVDRAIDFMESADLDEFLPAAVEALGLGDDVFAIELPVFLHYSLPDEESFMFVQDWMRQRGRIEGYYPYNDYIRSVR